MYITIKKMNKSFKLMYLYILFMVFSFMFCEQNFETEPENITLALNRTLNWSSKSEKKIQNTLKNSTINYSQYELNLRMVTTCITPNEDIGFCMPLENCTILMDQLENENARNFLRNSKCGPKNENSANPHVCCGKYDNYKKSKQEDPFPKNCGQSVQPKSRIVGGREAALGEFPWMARLIHKSKSNVRTFGCAGSLITAKFVLTAAHCLDSDNIKVLGPIFEVQLGEHNTDTKIDCNAKKTVCADKPQVVRVKKRIVHPNYNRSSIDHHNDIGLIHLKKAVQITSYVSPICLLTTFDFEPFEYWISGWGNTGKQNESPIKMKLSLPSYERFNCTEKYKLINVRVIDKQICAGGAKNKDSCTGDSGGPLMLVRDSNHWYAAGIVSFGLGCGREGWPGIYTNVTSYLPWIQKTILEKATAKS